MSDSPTCRPPRLAEWLLRALLPHGTVGDSIVGDTHEEFADYRRRRGRFPRSWYWLHAARVATAYAWPDGGIGDMSTLLGDLKVGARGLLRAPASAATAVVVLGMGIGLCAFMFSVIYGVYFRGLGVPDAGRLLVLSQTDLEQNQPRGVPLQDLADIRARQRSFEGLIGYHTGTVNLTADAGPVRYRGAYVSANAFEILRVPPALGRTFRQGDDRPGAPPDVVLGWETWRLDFGGDPGAIGRTVRVNGEIGTVIGVMPTGFLWPRNEQVWLPFREDPGATPRASGRPMNVLGRLADGVSREEAQAEMSAIAADLARAFPETNAAIGTALQTPVEASTGPPLGTVFTAMMTGAFAVLLVACANVANLLLARASLRHREASIRLALGSSRVRVMWPFLAEALVLSAAGAVLGVGLAYVGAAWFEEATNPTRTGRPYFMQFGLNLPILAMVVGTTVLTALVAGLAPAFRMSRVDVSAGLLDQGRGSTSRRSGRLSRALVVAEVALSCLLLVGAGLMVRSIVNLRLQSFPYPTDRLLTARLGLFASDYPDVEARRRLWSALEAELRTIPALASVTLGSTLPHMPAELSPVAIDGVAYDDAGDQPRVNRVVVADGFFETLDVAVAGRAFNTGDREDADPVAIVNQPMVDRYFGGGNPIGRRFREGTTDEARWRRVVGVVPDLHMQGFMPAGLPGFEPAGYYVPLRQGDARFMSIAAVPQTGDPLALAGQVRAAVRRLDADLPVYAVQTEADIIEDSVWTFGVFGSVFIAFGGAALVMAAVGLYGVLAFAVSRRTHEVGIRMALGAEAHDVVRLVVRQGAAQLGVGLAIGLALALSAAGFLTALMYEVNPRDPLVFGVVVAVVAGVGLLAGYFPARRATRVSPLIVLRGE